MATAIRNLRADMKYKFEFVVQALWTLTNLLAFGFLGFAVGQGNSEYAPAYSMALFFVASTAYWTLYSGNYEETVACLREETQRGTMGFLIVNDVNPLAIMIGRYISSSLKFLFVTLLFVVPVLSMMKNTNLPGNPNMLPRTVSEALYLLAIYVFVYLFMLAIATLVGSLSLIFKNTSTVNKIVLYSARIISSYYTPLAAFGAIIPGMDTILFYIPITTGLVMTRRILIEHTTTPPHGSYLSMFVLMAIIDIVILAISFIVVKKLSEKARLRGTLEFY